MNLYILKSPSKESLYVKYPMRMNLYMLKYAFVFSFLSPLKSFDDDLCHGDIKTPV
jgi:hypothetical protein